MGSFTHNTGTKMGEGKKGCGKKINKNNIQKFHWYKKL